MSPLLYLAIGLIGGGLIVAVIVLLTTRGKDGSAAAELVKRLEMIDRSLRDEFSRNREEAGAAAKYQREELATSLEGVRSIVDVRLKQLQDDNAKQIDKMRATVDEKLQGTLERRLGESFKLVSERLEQVHQGLGAMRQLASDVGGLQRVLTNVKTRGGWSEWQLGVLLDEMLASEQFAKNMKMRDDTDERVEFAIKLPGDENGAPVWLPVDAKVSDGTLRPSRCCAGKRRPVSGGNGNKNFGNAVEALRQGHLREIYQSRRRRPISR